MKKFRLVVNANPPDPTVRFEGAEVDHPILTAFLHVKVELLDPAIGKRRVIESDKEPVTVLEVWET